MRIPNDNGVYFATRGKTGKTFNKHLKYVFQRKDITKAVLYTLYIGHATMGNNKNNNN